MSAIFIRRSGRIFTATEQKYLPFYLREGTILPSDEYSNSDQGPWNSVSTHNLFRLPINAQIEEPPLVDPVKSIIANIEAQANASARYEAISSIGFFIAKILHLLSLACGTVTVIWSLVISHSYGFLSLVATFLLPPLSQMFWLWKTWTWPSLSGYAISFFLTICFAILARIVALLFGLSLR
jgi:hypothetical protein